MHHELFLELSLVLIGTGLIAAIIKLLRQPLIIGYIFAEGATYVIMPHYISSERLGHMLRKKSIKKSDFTPERERHLRYIGKHL